MNAQKMLGLFVVLLLVRPAFSQTPAYEDLSKQANTLLKEKNYALAAETFSKGFAANGYKGYATDRYNAACAWAMSGNPDSAFYHLFYLANRPTFRNFRTEDLKKDKDLMCLSTDKRWQELCDKVQKDIDTEEALFDRPLVAILDGIYTEDQKYRQQIDSIEKKHGRNSEEMKAHWRLINEKDSINLIPVCKILDERGWLGPEVVGQRGASTLFLVIQHSDIKIQEKYLPMMREAVKNKKAQGSSLALLEDRVSLRQGKKQIYGSQIGRKPDGAYYVQALEDPDNVDTRRASVGLPPLASYVSRWQIKWDVEAYKKELPELEKLLQKY
jgi:hypothetical protein